MKTIIKLIVFTLLLMFVTISGAQAASIVSPLTLNVVRGQSNTVALVYQFSNVQSTALDSTAGIFTAGGFEIGRVNTPLHTAISVGRGTVAETLVIPVAIAERAVQRGSARFAYGRTFTGTNTVTNNAGSCAPPCNPAPPVTITITENTLASMVVTGESVGPFSIKLISLYFENGRAETTVQKNIPGLKAFADIRYIGSGLLKGYWEVDGRMLSQVNQTLMSGQSVTLTTPEIPPLPTFEAGTHTVRFVITSPEQGIALPTMIYFVSTDESVMRPNALLLKSPATRSVLPYGTLQFQWQDFSSARYLVQFFEKPEVKPIFSAYTLKPFYQLPDAVLKGVFIQEKDYYWKVTGFDKQKRRTGESAVSRFSFK